MGDAVTRNAPLPTVQCPQYDAIFGLDDSGEPQDGTCPRLRYLAPGGPGCGYAGVVGHLPGGEAL